MYIHNGIRFSHNKERSPDACYDIDEPWRCYAKCNTTVTKGQILYDSTYTGSQIHRDRKQNDVTEARKGGS